MRLEDFISAESLIDENANYEKDIGNISRQLLAWAEREFNLALIREHFDEADTLLSEHGRAIYIHDLSKNILKNYCYAFSLLPLAEQGIQYYDHFKSRPAKRLSSFISHVIEFSSYAANRTRGAIAFPDLLAVLYAYYIKDNPPNSQLRQELQRAFYTFNQSLRAGAESLFINVSFFDRYFAEALFSNYPLFNLDGFMEFQRFVMEWHMKEVTTRQMLRFPVITAACVKDEDGHIRDREFLEFACRMNMRHTMYNFLVLEEPTAIASCCRLLNDKASFFNSYGSGGVQIGSHQVVSINLPHLWLRYGDGCEDALIEYAFLIRRFLDWHRKLLIEHQHLDKLYGLGFKSVNRMFSTLGIIGVWDFKKLSGWSWEEVRDMLKKMQDAYVKDSRYNIELVPGESAAIKLYRNDAREFEHPYLKGIHMYSNQVVSPWTEEVPLPRKVKINAMFRDIFTGGQMMFVNIPSAFQTWEQMARIVEGIGSVGVPYFCFDTTLTQCAQNHITLGEKERCPICNGVIKERFRRIVGYFVALDNAGERQHLDFPYRAPDRMGGDPFKFSS